MDNKKIKSVTLFLLFGLILTLVVALTSAQPGFSQNDVLTASSNIGLSPEIFGDFSTIPSQASFDAQNSKIIYPNGQTVSLQTLKTMDGKGAELKLNFDSSGMNLGVEVNPLKGKITGDDFKGIENVPITVNKKTIGWKDKITHFFWKNTIGRVKGLATAPFSGLFKEGVGFVPGGGVMMSGGTMLDNKLDPNGDLVFDMRDNAAFTVGGRDIAVDNPGKFRVRVSNSRGNPEEGFTFIRDEANGEFKGYSARGSNFDIFTEARRVRASGEGYVSESRGKVYETIISPFKGLFNVLDFVGNKVIINTGKGIWGAGDFVKDGIVDSLSSIGKPSFNAPDVSVSSPDFGVTEFSRGVGSKLKSIDAPSVKLSVPGVFGLGSDSGDVSRGLILSGRQFENNIPSQESVGRSVVYSNSDLRIGVQNGNEIIGSDGKTYYSFISPTSRAIVSIPVTYTPRGSFNRPVGQHAIDYYNRLAISQGYGDNNWPAIVKLGARDGVGLSIIGSSDANRAKPLADFYNVQITRK